MYDWEGKYIRGVGTDSGAVQLERQDMAWCASAITISTSLKSASKVGLCRSAATAATMRARFSSRSFTTAVSWE
jgi:hypothetical protein